jgi:hypothetical protein
MLSVPSLKPIMLRGVCSSGVVEDVLPNPSCDQRTATTPKPIRAEVADGVHRHLRVVGAGLDAQVAAAAVGVERVAGEVREVHQGLGALARQAEPGLAVLLEQRRPESDGQGQP